MASSYSELKFELISTGEQSGTWGDTTNTNIGTAINEAIAGMATVTINGDTTLAWLNTSASQDARNYVLKLAAGTVAAGFNLVVPTIEKPYVVVNESGYTATVKTSAGTGVAVPSGKSVAVYADGANVVQLLNHVPTLSASSLSLTTALPVSSGGTGAATLTGIVKGNGTSAMTAVTAPTGTIVGTTDTQTLTNKIIQLRVYSVSSFSGPTYSPAIDDYDIFVATAQSGPLTLGAPSGTPFNGQKMILRMTASSTVTLSFDTSSGGYRAVGVSLPTGVSSGYTTYIGCMWNSTASRWDVLAVNTGV